MNSLSSGMLSKQDMDLKRKKKEKNRREIKQQRKNRVKENRLKDQPASIDKEAFVQQKKERIEAENNKEQMDTETLLNMTFAQKLVVIS